jgi:hypothetical protein
MSALSSEPFSDNRKPVLSFAEGSAIQKLKSLGFVVFAIAFTVWGAAAQAQSPAKLPKIGFLSSGYGEGSSGWRGSFVREFGKLGYVEGKNVAFEFRNANTKYDRLPALADELVRLSRRNRHAWSK